MSDTPVSRPQVSLQEMISMFELLVDIGKQAVNTSGYVDQATVDRADEILAIMHASQELD